MSKLSPTLGSEGIGTSSKGNFLSLNMYGVPLWAWFAGFVILTLSIVTKSIETSFAGSIMLLYVVGFFFGKVGDNLPIWKDYLGGGALLSFLGASFLVAQGVIPAEAVDGVKNLFDDMGLLDFFIAVIITSSILAINRKFLAKAIGAFIPMVVVGTITAIIFAIVGGFLVGVPYKEVVINYAFPIMGGGNGAGAIPMSKIWGQVTQQDPTIWYSSAIAILTIANIFSIIFAAILNGIGKKMPKWTGNGELIKGQVTAANEAKKENKATMTDAVFGLFVAMAFFALANLVGNGLLPSIGSFKIHPYAYMVIFLILANGCNVIPQRAKDGLKKVNEFMMGKIMYVFLAGVGITFTDFSALLHAVNLQTAVISIFTIAGVSVGCWFFAKLVGFYEIEAVIAGGLCHVNRGGSGDLEILGASNRMILMSYAQLATRLGGAMILVAAGVIFELWLK
ncbi:2-hydroxycarboxylate transporter family protein [Paenibacillus melissococcoides]|uniref:2-hydroxycarboxylate transporter family protein n=1 Tax=Paenibacillus melissococcoides TaxID=2912268 RepID=A0ABM9G0C3_9BACL|nr:MULTISPECIES: 2-hydroxycarboxylate transporter family protein [Paenibacillus]MEB9894943.1 2-hydroxycarboxylate transporter family protein [Bacillus cereus]NGP61015.1 2-hydroxycarboxylate transporter family protein [Paenibacillus thiaminolyticus]CAH8244906.1 2-hydroxycarboxylate transporter family protein [Paenibacillus melissococcoides]CAH8709327.1 2-hydroxycarboxylate transporter family protein [Paenibacillus melissococcoides]CAH8710054.1 2-hydroxycarboxylate transporter family protein [Pa